VLLLLCITKYCQIGDTAMKSWSETNIRMC
jgi:hypothetical protein